MSACSGGARACARPSFLQNAGGALSKALAAAQDEQRKLADARDSAEREAAEARALREKLEADAAALDARKRDEELKFRNAPAKAELEFARGQAQCVLALVEKLEGAQSLKESKAAAQELAARINEQETAARSLKPSAPGLPLELRVGARAKHKGLDAEVEILEIDGDTITVKAGAMRMRVPASELSGARGGVKAAAPPRAQKPADVAPAPLTLAAPKLDVRGERAEDALRRLEQFLDRVAREGDPEVLVVHGHGTGALKTSVREYLTASPYASSFRPGDSHEGGDGVTVISLR